MDKRLKIKVIKKGEIKTVEATRGEEENLPPYNGTQLASTVSTWINEFQERRREETETAVQRFNT